jgi:hypothetical protein
VKRSARGQKQENRARASKAGQGSRAEGKSKDRGEDRGRDEGGGEDIDVPNIYSSKMNK